MALTWKMVYVKNPDGVAAAIAAGKVQPGTMLTYEDGHQEFMLEDGSLLSIVNEKDPVIIEIETASETWNLQHNLGIKYPDIRLYDEEGNTVYGDINYYSTNLAIVSFDVAVAGKAIVK